MTVVETHRILVVDDDEVDRLAIQRALRSTDLDVTIETAEDGAVALETMLAGRFTYVLLDYRLPPSNGLQVLREARARGIEVPIVMLTGEGDEQLVTEAMRAGASDYLAKAALSGESLSRSITYVSRIYQADRQLRQLASFPEQSPSPIIEVTSDGRVTYLNPAAREEMPDLEAQASEHPLLASWAETVCQLGSGQRSISREVLVGSSYYHLTVSRAPDPHLLRIYAIDITDRRKAEEQLIRSAFYDMLTNLPNRALFSDRLGRTLERGKRHSNHRFAVLFLDLDRFKMVNDSLGHLSGDQLLVAAARRLRTVVRSEDTVARFGGDEFAVLIENPKDISDVMYVANRIRGEFDQPFDLEDAEVYTTASIGIALSDRRYESTDDLLRDADIAMYQAKARGGARCQVFDAEMHAQAIAALQLQTDLRHAITQRQLQLHYLPIIDLSDGGLAGFEALLRWHHPSDGIISPGRFLSSARDAGIIVEIDRWVLENAIRQMDRWCELFGAERVPVVSINLSSGPFFRNDLVDLIRRLAQETDIGRCRVRPTLEITESTIMEDIDETIKVMAELRQLGFDILVDGFGTSSFSLTALRKLPISCLEIDRSIVSELPRAVDSLEITRVIVALARNLGLDVVAEGIEQQAQLQVMCDLKCSYGKGFLFGKPMPAAAAEALIRHAPVWSLEAAAGTVAYGTDGPAELPGEV